MSATLSFSTKLPLPPQHPKQDNMTAAQFKSWKNQMLTLLQQFQGNIVRGGRRGGVLPWLASLSMEERTEMIQVLLAPLLGTKNKSNTSNHNYQQEGGMFHQPQGQEPAS